MDSMVDMVDMESTARGPLMPRLMLIPTTMEAMAMGWDMDTMVDTALDSMVDMVDMESTTRGLLMPRPRLIPTTLEATMVWDMDMDMASMDMVMDMAMATTDKSSQSYLLHAQHQQGDLVIHQDLSVNHQLLCQHQMD